MRRILILLMVLTAACLNAFSASQAQIDAGLTFVGAQCGSWVPANASAGGWAFTWNATDKRFERIGLKLPEGEFKMSSANGWSPLNLGSATINAIGTWINVVNAGNSSNMSITAATDADKKYDVFVRDENSSGQWQIMIAEHVEAPASLSLSLGEPAVTHNSASVGFTVAASSHFGTNYTLTSDGGSVSGNTVTYSGLTPATEYIKTITVNGTVDGTDYSDSKTVTFTTASPSVSVTASTANVTGNSVDVSYTISASDGMTDYKVIINGTSHDVTALSGTITVSGLAMTTQYSDWKVSASAVYATTTYPSEEITLPAFTTTDPYDKWYIRGEMNGWSTADRFSTTDGLHYTLTVTDNINWTSGKKFLITKGDSYDPKYGSCAAVMGNNTLTKGGSDCSLSVSIPAGAVLSFTAPEGNSSLTLNISVPCQMEIEANVTATTATTATVAYTATSGATVSYSSNGTDWTTVASSPFTISGLNPDTEYTYTVKAAKDGNEATATVTFTTGIELTGVTATAAAKKATVAYTATSGATVSYSSNGTDWTTASASPFTIEGLTPATEYTYTVKAVKNGKEATATVTFTTAPFALTLGVATVAQKTASVPYTVAKAETSTVTVEYSIDGGASWTASTASPIALTDLTPSAEYTLQVKMTDSADATCSETKEIRFTTAAPIVAPTLYLRNSAHVVDGVWAADDAVKMTVVDNEDGTATYTYAFNGVTPPGWRFLIGAADYAQYKFAGESGRTGALNLTYTDAEGIVHVQEHTLYNHKAGTDKSEWIAEPLVNPVFTFKYDGQGGKLTIATAEGTPAEVYTPALNLYHASDAPAALTKKEGDYVTLTYDLPEFAPAGYEFFVGPDADHKYGFEAADATLSAGAAAAAIADGAANPVKLARNVKGGKLTVVYDIFTSTYTVALAGEEFDIPAMKLLTKDAAGLWIDTDMTLAASADGKTYTYTAAVAGKKAAGYELRLTDGHSYYSAAALTAGTPAALTASAEAKTLAYPAAMSDATVTFVYSPYAADRYTATIEGTAVEAVKPSASIHGTVNTDPSVEVAMTWDEAAKVWATTIHPATRGGFCINYTRPSAADATQAETLHYGSAVGEEIAIDGMGYGSVTVTDPSLVGRALFYVPRGNYRVTFDPATGIINISREAGTDVYAYYVPASDCTPTVWIYNKYQKDGREVIENLDDKWENSRQMQECGTYTDGRKIFRIALPAKAPAYNKEGASAGECDFTRAWLLFKENGNGMWTEEICQLNGLSKILVAPQGVIGMDQAHVEANFREVVTEPTLSTANDAVDITAADAPAQLTLSLPEGCSGTFTYGGTATADVLTIDLTQFKGLPSHHITVDYTIRDLGFIESTGKMTMAVLSAPITLSVVSDGVNFPDVNVKDGFGLSPSYDFKDSEFTTDEATWTFKVNGTEFRHYVHTIPAAYSLGMLRINNNDGTSIVNLNAEDVTIVSELPAGLTRADLVKPEIKLGFDPDGLAVEGFSFEAGVAVYKGELTEIIIPVSGGKARFSETRNPAANAIAAYMSAPAAEANYTVALSNHNELITLTASPMSNNEMVEWPAETLTLVNSQSPVYLYEGFHTRELVKNGSADGSVKAEYKDVANPWTTAYTVTGLDGSTVNLVPEHLARVEFTKGDKDLMGVYADYRWLEYNYASSVATGGVVRAFSQLGKVEIPAAYIYGTIDWSAANGNARAAAHTGTLAVDAQDVVMNATGATPAVGHFATVGYVEANQGTSGVESVSADAAEAEYFTLQGISAQQPLAPGVYIRRQGATTTKITVK